MWVCVPMSMPEYVSWERTQDGNHQDEVDDDDDDVRYVGEYSCTVFAYQPTRISTLTITIYGDWIVRRNDKLNDE